MKRNMGNADRIIRALVAVFIFSLYYSGVLQPTLAIVLLIVGIIFIVTSLFARCPLYYLFGINTCSHKHSPDNRSAVTGQH
jgi:hypothetical protein